MFFICLWVGPNTTDHQFENSVPILFLGNWLEKHDCKEVFHLIFLHGKDNLSQQYISKLQSINNFEIFDYSNYYTEVSTKYHRLSRFGKYETNCFLRWIIIQNHVKKNNITQQFIHIDGDILFNANPTEILDDLRNLTFTLQGCPGFTSIFNYQWLEDFKREFDLFYGDIERYSVNAWSERSGWEFTHKSKWAGSRYRQIISSDQDLISHLIHSNKIFQDSPVSFAKNLNLYYAENPLYIHSHAQIQLGTDSNIKFSITNNECFLNKKKIAIWHFQSNFVRYVNHFAFLNLINYPFHTPNERTKRKSWGLKD